MQKGKEKKEAPRMGARVRITSIASPIDRDLVGVRGRRVLARRGAALASHNFAFGLLLDEEYRAEHGGYINVLWEDGWEVPGG